MKFNELTVNSSRLWESLMEMAEIGKAPENGVSRPALSKEDGKARRPFDGMDQTICR